MPGYMPHYPTYIVPNCVLNCLTLTHLELFECLFKPPNSFIGFRHLLNLHLQKISFAQTTALRAITCPLLVNLALVDYHGTQYLNIIVSSELESLVVHGCPYLDLNYNNKGLRKLQLKIDEHEERATLEKLLLSVAATLEFLQMGVSFLEVST